MKKLELEGSVVFYGTLEEIEQAARENEILLPKNVNELKVCSNYGSDGQLLIFIIKPEKEEEKEKVIRMAEIAILNHAFLQVSGEEIPEDDCLEEAKKFLSSSSILRKEIFEEKTWKK